MSDLTLWLPTRNGTNWGGSTLYVKEMDTPFLPREGDMIHLVLSDGEWGVTGYVKSTYWDGDGSVHATIQEHVIDPPEDFRPHRTQTTWWTDRDGALGPLLLASGWREYKP
jgi:hypothetical protein